MKRFFKYYRSSFALLLSMVIGLIIGLIFKEKATALSPLGTLFINLLSTIIVPLIFTTITLSIAKIKPQIVAKLLKNIVIVFVIMSLLSVLVGIISTYAYRFVSTQNTIETHHNVTTENTDLNFLERTVNMISVNDFNSLLTKENMIALIVFSIIIGIAAYKSKEKAKPFISFLESCEEILMRVITIIMYYAPIGICAFFASMVGTLGGQIAADYLKVFIYYAVISILFAAIVYSVIAKISGKSVKEFWKESIPIILCSLSTCSSASCLPININTAEKLGVSDQVSKTTISLGTSFHKDGSVIDSVFKIMFLVYLFNSNINIIQVIIVALAATLLITAVPVGGGTISEMCIITLLGFPVAALPILTIIATITDAPATMLNALGDTSASLLVDKLMKKDTISS
ncbi:MAG: dicarboxylate/amino acid:cation symporter [Firmicutes bacterium]|nr:dicarboxylate/amino acid:cation symporter [Bacillota bacterium]